MVAIFLILSGFMLILTSGLPLDRRTIPSRDEVTNEIKGVRRSAYEGSSTKNQGEYYIKLYRFVLSKSKPWLKRIVKIRLFVVM